MYSLKHHFELLKNDKIKNNNNFEKINVSLHSTQNCTLRHLNPRVSALSNLCNY